MAFGFTPGGGSSRVTLGPQKREISPYTLGAGAGMHAGTYLKAGMGGLSATVPSVVGGFDAPGVWRQEQKALKGYSRKHEAALDKWWKRYQKDIKKSTKGLLKIPKVEEIMSEEDRAALAERMYGGTKQSVDEGREEAMRSALAELRARGLGYMAPQIKAGVTQGASAELGRGWRESQHTANQQFIAAKEAFEKLKIAREHELTGRHAIAADLRRQAMSAITPFIEGVNLRFMAGAESVPRLGEYTIKSAEQALTAGMASQSAASQWNTALLGALSTMYSKGGSRSIGRQPLGASKGVAGGYGAATAARNAENPYSVFSKATFKKSSPQPVVGPYDRSMLYGRSLM